MPNSAAFLGPYQQTSEYNPLASPPETEPGTSSLVELVQYMSVAQQHVVL